MKTFTQFQPVSKQLILQVSILKTMMYCGVLWGLFNEGWAIKTEPDQNIFPFWLNAVQANQYAKVHWPNYRPRKITPQDFQEALLPTLTRFKIIPALFNASRCKFRLSTQQMHHFFFNSRQIRFA
ncbi:DUF2750 domain-containing protein [Acinetobacter larvae]|uniref:DUF2750 domain-containing protein n=1 Tax=Acinetobacter larvae TaxID=1789224 RepID=A0A1B2M0D5_9GAMM|nr:DUF2750 domain-containing protein [Acinetobacter larvae]AOA58629.1 hypothetical protein BFG52_09880 [Acinetobacter larvae]